MKTQLLYAASLAILLGACQKPTEVQVTDETLLDVENVTEPDPSVVREGVDSTALLPRDQDKFSGFITVASVKYNDGISVQSRSFAHVMFENRLNPLIDGGRKYFFLQPLGILRMVGSNTDIILFGRPRRSLSNVSLGFEYVREIANYMPGTNYTFTSTGSDSVEPFSVSAESPENMVVQAPVGGQRVARDRDMNLRWSGRGNIFLIISALNAQGKLIPVLSIKPRKNEGRALLTKKLLNALPGGSYVFTFGLSNRNETSVGRFRGRVLVQGLSVYNVRVELI